MTRAEAKAKGLKRYFLGKVCPRGHNADRLVVNATCIRCLGEKILVWQRKNVAKRRKTNQRYRDNHREAVRARGRAYEATRRPQNNAKNAKWRKAHPDRAKNATRSWAVRNADKLRLKKRDWNRKNPDRVRTYHRNRKAASRGNNGRHSQADIDAIFKSQKSRCAYCRTGLKRRKRHVDHIKALSKGGTNDRRNLQILCVKCNLEKHARDPIDFARSKGKLI